MYAPKFLVVLMVMLPWNFCSITADFTRIPDNVTQAEGLNAVFYCQYPTADIVVWIVNGVFIHNNLPNSITFSSIYANGGTVHILTVMAIPENNGTIVQCLVVVQTGRQLISSNVSLVIQEPLDGVINLTSTSTNDSITITWDPPFSLDLTTADPDIAYCVDVFNITSDGQREMIVSDCSRLQPQYNFTVDSPDLNDLFEFTVTPRSNVEGAMNGTTIPVLGYFLGIPHSPTNISMDVSINPLIIQIVISNTVFHGLQPDTYNVDVRSIDGKGEIDIPVGLTVVFTENQTELVLLDPSVIGQHRLCLMTISATNGVGTSTRSEEIELSTHDVQNIEIKTSSHPGHINISCSFIDGSEDTGYFMILYSDLDIVYRVIERDVYSPVTTSTVTDLRGGEYALSVFDIDERGVPHNNSAGLPRMVNVLQHSMGTQSTSDSNQPTIITTAGVLSLDSGQLCISCTFTDSSTTSCVSIIHSVNGHMTSPYGLLNITVNEHLNQDGSVYECLPLPTDDYHVAVFGYGNGRMESTPGLVTMVTVAQKSKGGRGTYLAYVAIVAALTTCLVLMTVGSISIIYLRKKSNSESDKSDTNKKCNTYETIIQKCQRKAKNENISSNETHTYEEVKLNEISNRGDDVPVYDKVMPNPDQVILQGNTCYGILIDKH